MKLCPSCRQAFSGEQWVCPHCAWVPRSDAGLLALSPQTGNKGDGFDPGYFARLFALESASFWFRARNRLIVWALQRYLPDARNFLEVGCGTGYVLSALADARPQLRLTGSELFTQGLKCTAQRVSGATLLQLDARNLPFEDEFDAFGAFDVLEHIDDDQRVLEQAHRALHPGGGLLLTVPQHRFLWSALDEYALHQRRYVRTELLAKVRAAGFDVLRCSSFVSLLMPALLASRATRGPRKRLDPESEFNIPRFLNYAFEKIMAVERTLIRAGVSFHFGGSLLLVARKSAKKS
jgi:SAM-dependent methyltransferase